MSDFNHIVYFEVFGKKMKMKLTAATEAEAREKVLDYVKYSTKFYKINKVSVEDPLDKLKDMFRKLSEENNNFLYRNILYFYTRYSKLLKIISK